MKIIGILLCLGVFKALAFPQAEETISCVHPTKLVEIEKECETDPDVTAQSGSFLEQIHENVQAAIEQTKRLFNIAKKKLGFSSDEESTTDPVKKCEFYYCMLKKMEVLNSNDYANKTLLEQWITNNVANSEESSIYAETDNCLKEAGQNDTSGNKPNSCEAARTLIKCLNMESMVKRIHTDGRIREC